MNRAQLALVLRVVAELIAIVGLGVLGGSLADGILGVVLGVLFVVVAVLIWGVFRVPGDPGEAIVPIPGPVRLGVEIVLLGGTGVALWSVGAMGWAGLVIVGTVLQFGVGYDRVLWLLAGSRSSVDTRDPRA